MLLPVGFENGHLLRVSMVAQQGTDTVVNVFHYDLINASGFPANDPQSLADLFRDDVMPEMATLFDSSWTVQPVVVMDEKDPLNPTAPRQEWVSGSGLTGTKTTATELLPRAICAVAKWSTNNIGRRFRGRSFVPGTFTEGDQSAGLWTAAAQTAIQAYLNAIPIQPDIAGGPSDSTANLCVYSRTQRSQNLDPYASHVQSHTLRTQLHWLRSRVGQ